MDCQRANEEISAAALLPPDQELATEVQRHLESCAACREEFRTQQETRSLLAATLPSAAPSQSLEDRLMARVSDHPAPAPRYSRRIVVLKYVLAASILFLMVSGTLFRLSSLTRNQPTDRDMERMRDIAAQMEKLDELQRVFAAPRLKYVSLESAPAALVSCYLVHDPYSNQVHFFARNLQTPSANLHVWLLDDSERVLTSAKVATKKRVGSAVLTVDDTTEISTALVTVEPVNAGNDQPSSDVVFRASVLDL